MIELSCPHCGEALLAEDEWVGKRIKCPSCGGKTVVAPVPVASGPLKPPEALAATLPPRPESARPLNLAEAETLAPPAIPAVALEAGTVPPSAPAPPLAARPATVPGHEVLKELGRGGMGVVYKARHTKLGRVVALKMILSGAHAGADDLARFRTEAEAIARLQHPNIVQIHEVGDCDGLPYFSLEFCGGGSLEKKLAGTPLPPKQAAALVETLARAMHAAHEQGVIHRDLKPANVLLAKDGTPKVTDFGLAKKLDEVGQTATGAVMGTPSYMAPEQAGMGSPGRKPGESTVGPLADVYALGAILYECLTGRPPFKAATALDTVLQVISDEPVPPRQLQSRTPRDLETICLKCLQKEPRKRYASAKALAGDLRRFQAGEPIKARPVGRVERAMKWVRRKPMVAALLAVMLLAAVGWVPLLFQKYHDAQIRARAGIAAKRYQSDNYLRSIALAMHNYHSTNGNFPPAYSANKDGAPLLSWRVHILPYFDQDVLYAQFHLDEPWDSPHNKKLIDKMPERYRSPVSAVGPGMTNYQTVRGPNTMFPSDKGLRKADIRDLSNTIMLLEVSDKKAVIWTKPDDFEFNEKDPTDGLMVSQAACLAALGDGSVRFITDPQEWKNLYIRKVRNPLPKVAE